MKFLFVSDLDGTLLNDDAYVSDYSKSAINRAVDKGFYFTVATARTIASTHRILEGINVNAPVVLMNGTAVFDLQNNSYINVESISKAGKEHLFCVLKSYKISGFLYCIDNGCLSTYYENAVSPVVKKFVRERERRYNKKFKKITHFSDCASRNVVYFSICDKIENLEPAYNELSKCEDLHVEFYTDTYNEGYMYLEICSRKVSKYNAIQMLRNKYGFEKIIGFGDNLNDLPMFEACDECYAVSSANEIVKSRATGVIGSNNDDGVVKFIEEYLKNLPKPKGDPSL